MLTADHTQQIMALEELFKSHYYPLRAYALRFICNREMAEDMVQDALFELWSRRDTIRFDDKNAVKSYLFKSIHKGSVYDYGVRDNRDTPANTFEGGADIQYGRFLDELAWEFNQEGRRRQDMIRFGVYTQKSWSSHTPNGDYRVLFPIPQREMDANANLKQNLGY